MAFQIDGTTVKKYSGVEPIPPFIDTALDGSLNFGIHWTFILSFPTMTADEWQVILNKCIDGAVHTMNIEDPTTNNTETLYSNVRLRRLAGNLGQGKYVYGAQVEVTRVLVT